MKLLSPAVLSFAMVTSIASEILASPLSPRPPTPHSARHRRLASPLSPHASSPGHLGTFHEVEKRDHSDRKGHVIPEDCQPEVEVVYQTVFHTVTKTVDSPRPTMPLQNHQPVKSPAASRHAAISQVIQSSRKDGIPGQATPSSAAEGANPKSSTQVPASASQTKSSAGSVKFNPAETTSAANPGALASSAANKPVISQAANKPVPNTSGDYPSNKRGLCYNSAAAAAPYITAGKIGWGQNWAVDDGGLSGAKHYPQYWGTKAGMKEAFHAAAPSAKILFGFNEPEPFMCQYGQSCIEVGKAVEMYKTELARYHNDGKVIVAPTIAWSKPEETGRGVHYLDQFMAACKPDAGCYVDDLALHWYGQAGWTQAFKDYVSSMSQRYGSRNVWVHEMRVDSGDANAFLADVVPWLEAQPYVKGYAYFRADDMNAGSGAGQFWMTK